MWTSAAIVEQPVHRRRHPVLLDVAHADEERLRQAGPGPTLGRISVRVADLPDEAGLAVERNGVVEARVDAAGVEPGAQPSALCVAHEVTMPDIIYRYDLVQREGKVRKAVGLARGEAAALVRPTAQEPQGPIRVPLPIAQP